jgi:hypothetical protein
VLCGINQGLGNNSNIASKASAIESSFSANHSLLGFVFRSSRTSRCLPTPRCRSPVLGPLEWAPREGRREAKCEHRVRRREAGEWGILQLGDRDCWTREDSLLGKCQSEGRPYCREADNRT